MLSAQMQQVIITEAGGPEKLVYESVAIPTLKITKYWLKYMPLGSIAQIFYSAKAYIQCQQG